VAEFSIIDQFCTNLGAANSLTDISVGDDAAVINVPADKRLVISVDTMVAGVHFFPDTTPANVAHKLLAVNLSDMAAMGAQAKWATMTLTTPSLDIDWLSEFSKSIDAMAEQYGVQLIGGDTTQGQLNLSMQIIGLLPKSKALTRSGAMPDDDIYVSNTIGDAALALGCVKNQKQANNATVFDNLLNANLRRALEQPAPQTQLGMRLLEFANSCIDISDGLVADLSHIAQQSGVNMVLDIEQLPLSDDYQRYLKQGGSVDLALSGGDDYQLAFTVSVEHREAIDQLAVELNMPITRIGRVVSKAKDQTTVQLRNQGEPYTLTQYSGYQHFQGA